MMKTGLIAADGHNFPNLALMKIAAFHKQQGDTVEWVNYLERYDKVYISKIFTFTPDIHTCIQANEIERGGTGYDTGKKLPPEIDSLEPDYSIYPVCKWYDGKTAYGFLTRGCIRKCPWCIVPQKEGTITPYRDIETVLQGMKAAILMDNNVLASNHGLHQIERIIDLKCKVDFNQGLDARLVTDDIARMLSCVKWLNYIRFSCDTMNMIEPLMKAVERLNKYGVKNWRIFVYVLVNDVSDADRRCSILKKAGITPFAQPYRDFTGKNSPTVEQVRFANYVNCHQIFKQIEFKDYKTNKNLKKYGYEAQLHHRH
jgi:hypothetical protein